MYFILKIFILCCLSTQLLWAMEELPRTVSATTRGGVVGSICGSCGEIVKSCSEVIADSGASTALQHIAEETAEEVITNGTRKSIAEAALTASKYTKLGVGVGIGVGVAAESIVTGYRLYKYNTDYQYLWCDLKSDVGRSWATTAVATAIGVACLPLGWWAILPAVGAGLFFSWLFRKIEQKWFHKSQKEKLYIEYGLNEKSSLKDLKRVRKKILKIIHKEKLHPDQWPKDLTKSEKTKRLEKFLWMSSLRDFLQKDIDRGKVCFDDDNEQAPRMLENRKVNATEHLA